MCYRLNASERSAELPLLIWWAGAGVTAIDALHGRRFSERKRQSENLNKKKMIKIKQIWNLHGCTKLGNTTRFAQFYALLIYVSQTMAMCANRQSRQSPRFSLRKISVIKLASLIIGSLGITKH